MREFFSLEGPFNKYGGFIADMFILNLMWIIFSIPLITIGASTSAMFYVATRRIADREGYITSDFWYAFKANFKRATMLWLIVFFIGGVLLWNIFGGAMEYVPERTVGFVFPAQIIFFIQLLLLNSFIFPVTARFDMKVVEVLKYSFFMANRHLLTSLLCAITLVGLVFLSWLSPMVFFIAPGVYACIASFLIMRIFKRYRPDMDPDPIVEIQQREAEKAEERRRAEIQTLEGDDE